MAEGRNRVIQGNIVAARALVLITARREDLQGSDISVSLLFRTRRIVKRLPSARDYHDRLISGKVLCVCESLLLPGNMRLLLVRERGM